MARVDRLDEEVKQVLRVASVVGRSFLYRVLKAISEAGQTLDHCLTELQQTELIHEKQVLPELEYIFKHALAQEATYESILLKKRRELHARVAQTIESLFTERLEEFYGLLAMHYSKAEVWDKAQEYLLKAGDQAGRMAADAEALSLYEQSIAAYARAFGDQWDPLQRAALERKMGEALLRRGEYALANERFEHALRYLDYRLPRSRGEVRRALLRELMVQIHHRLQRKSSPPLAEEARPGTEDEVNIYSHMGFISAFTDAERFLLLAFRMLNVAEERDYGPGIVIGSCQLGIALDFLPLPKVAALYHRSGTKTAERLGQAYALGAAHFGLQVHEFYTGNLEASLEHGRRVIQIYRQAGDLEEWGFATTFHSGVCIQMCKFDEALAATQETLNVGIDAGFRALCCWSQTSLGILLRRQGKLDEAIASQQKALELARAIPDFVYQVGAGADLAFCYLEQGNWQAALTELELCQQVAREHNVVEPHTRVILSNLWAMLYLYAAEHDDITQRGTWLKKARQACQSAVRTSSVCVPRIPEALRLRGTYEWLHGNPVAAQKWWEKSVSEAGRMGVLYDVGATYTEMGRRLGDRAYLEKAETVFAKIGSDADVMHARRLMIDSATG